LLWRLGVGGVIGVLLSEVLLRLMGIRTPQSVFVISHVASLGSDVISLPWGYWLDVLIHLMAYSAFGIPLVVGLVLLKRFSTETGNGWTVCFIIVSGLGAFVYACIAMGVQLWPVLQDLTQLKDIYPNRWESFLGCAGVQMFFAPREYSSSEEISKLCGDLTISVPSSSSGTTVTPNPQTGQTTVSSTSSYSNSYQSRREQLAQDIRRMKDDQFILFVDSAPGMYLLAKRKPYWRMKCGALASPDPYHKSDQTALPPPPGAPGLISG